VCTVICSPEEIWRQILKILLDSWNLQVSNHFRCSDVVSDLKLTTPSLDEQISATQRGLDQAGVSMPNFGNVRTSLRHELNEVDEEDDVQYEPIFVSKYSSTIVSPTTPDLIEESDSDDEHVFEEEITEEESK
jgi:hypothetical protein